MSSLTNVFLRHYREVLGFLSLRTGSRDVAQDCAQDTWIKLAEFRDKTLPDNERAYVFRVAANIATDWHRRRGREITALADYAAAQPPAFEADTLDVASANQLLHRLEAALLRQPRRSLDVFVLHRHEGLTYRAIAERLAISVSAVEKHMMRILLACDQALTA
ncbi:MAG: RNA polymerase sigma factor [Achromobacter pulmonis]|uniref:RNA polymerase sigma factor YlaC n=1 Tax=Achromobacter pulmonis TaxID=1389932 RepID=A0A6S7CLR8_9BURK|nr:RNA polymerase sigma factor [Achromobacter pulmonis]MCF7769740.1 RNA polymerase sigma factor [Achromobacter pulmonis]MPT27389.1 RNA polymerase sigma factor [Achromobacter sp.]CAB3628812.1 RNA polymerase sigma factor YlaC [Achromobacter pulmonis]CAB3853469.1 RNA polymerase sigma factor YlaC [Achromobacter pulmonis]